MGCGCSGGCHSERKGLEAADEDAGDVSRGRIRIQLKGAGSRQQFLENDPGLEPGQAGANAKVDAPPERQMILWVFPMEVDLVGMRKTVWVTVGGCPEQE